MVFYFSTDRHVENSNDWLIYMGRDKHENEDLIKYGWPDDIWFHVDNMSSAHVYLRMPRGHSMDDIPADVLEECCQLTKANSIQGCKVNNVDIVYTRWSNLKKTASMEVGQVSFHRPKEVKKTTVEKKKNEIVNRLNKTKRELYPDLALEREGYDREMSGIKKRELQAQKLQEKALTAEKQRQKELQEYRGLMDADAMESNKSLASKYASVEDYEDDFM